MIKTSALPSLISNLKLWIALSIAPLLLEAGTSSSPSKITSHG
jgi:hypothetical protein